MKTGIMLGDDVYWNPASLPNSSVVLVGTSGSGKSQTLKTIAYEFTQVYPETCVILLDLHGDLHIVSETCYPLHMSSPYGINPLLISLDPEGGGPALQAIAMAATLRKALAMGANQEGLLLTLLKECYLTRGILQSDKSTWTREPPNFGDLQSAIDTQAQDGCKESRKLQLKMAATFEYGVFNRPQPSLSSNLIRFDLSKLPSELGAIIGEALAKQLFDSYRLMGETKSKVPKLLLLVDEAKHMIKSRACDSIATEGRKFGIALGMVSQSEKHLSPDVIQNSALKIVLQVDASECKKVAAKFRFSEVAVAGLEPLQGLVRMGKDTQKINLLPYYKRV